MSSFFSESILTDQPFAEDSSNYSNLTELPSAGFNAVYKARRFGKWLILQALKPEFRGNPLYESLLRKEFEIGKTLDHPNIVTIFEMYRDEKLGNCLVMDYVQGRPLKAFFDEKPSPRVQDKVIREILDAMVYYHSNQVVHRDLKSSNILITDNCDNVKIIDFGFADGDNYAMLKQPAGTRHYAAPEQFDPDCAVDNRADLYAFGAMLDAYLPKATRRKYRSIIRKCTQPDREQRYHDAQEILQEMDADIRKRRTRRLVGSNTVLLLLLVPLIMFLVRRTTDDQPRYHNIVDGALPGLFSVSDSTQVRFARGNLQYQPSTGKWRFAYNQYDVIGMDNEKVSPTYNGWIDLFGYGTSGYDGKMPYMTSKSDSNYVVGRTSIAGTPYDWGVNNAIENGGNEAGKWHTLSADEWLYLVCIRPNANKLYSTATINGIGGYIFFPDDWNHSDGLLFQDPAKGYATNVLTIQQWVTLQDAGVLFLPAAGRREGQEVLYFGQYGYYWDNTIPRNGIGHHFGLTPKRLDSDIDLESRDHYLSLGYSQAFGHSVRLVQDK